MQHHRGSTKNNTWTLSADIMDSMSIGDTLCVSNDKNRSTIYTYQDVRNLTATSGWITSHTGFPAQQIRFPWHPLNIPFSGVLDW